jgi:hypothetical protein
MGERAERLALLDWAILDAIMLAGERVTNYPQVSWTNTPILMNGPLAQFVALTCHANAFLRNGSVPRFFPNNSTCQFCDSVKFIETSKSIFGKARENSVAATPNDWFESLKKTGATGVRLSCTPQNNAGISDRTSSGFVGGGGTWAMEALGADGKSSIWLSRWTVWNQNAPERRIWRVVYGLVSRNNRRIADDQDLQIVASCLRSALFEIRSFSEQSDCGGFTACFDRAIETIDTHGINRHGHHKDLVVEGTVPELAVHLLEASQSAWVFGGMGSWNDLTFEGNDQKEYDRVSDQLFKVLNKTIEAATNASCVSVPHS